ncbi:MAG: acyltransferase family protein [bacterium]|nr:acyltransferase family protein [bacterium]
MTIVAETESPKRIESIDIAKGIAIICVILGHLGIPEINRIVYTFHIPIFYFIAGYFVSDKKNVSSFIKDKARTLLQPYYVLCLIMIVLATLDGALVGSATLYFQAWTYAALYASGDTYTSPFYIRAIGAIWFLWALFWGSLLLRISLNYKSVIRIGFIIGIFICGYFSRTLFWFPLSIQAGACAALFMYIGWLLRQIKDNATIFSHETRIFGTVCAFTAWMFFIRDFQSFWLVHCDVGRGAIDIFNSFCACASVIIISCLIANYTDKLHKTLAYLGRYSLLVLGMHIIELNLFPWQKLVSGQPFLAQLAIIITGKLTLDLLGAWSLSKSHYIRRIFGYSH